ncbi:peptidoglycan D,D-transpeptidase FtsI family protein [Cohnella suwonensis]|uniref:Peptidoglycan D,D-transpeptidase FtsI family protein n=1 Tax=Cohnella suwonensis TaxID=696072 RepID=A0ABW0LW41_9BACL
MSNKLTEEAQKREIRNRRHFSFRLNVFFFLTFFVFSTLIVRLAYLQFVEGESLRAKEHEIGSKTVPVPPIRGNIYDSTGQVAIAYSLSTQSLYYTLDMKMKDDEGMELAGKLVGVFNMLGTNSVKPLTVQDVYDDMDLKGAVHYSFQPRRIKTGLTQKEIAYFSEHREDFKGIDVVEESIRQYSKDKVAVQLVGYMKRLSGVKDTINRYKEINKDLTDDTLRYLDSEDVGVDGLELMYQDELRGRNGVKEFPVNSLGEIIGPMKLTKPIKGENLYLTINKNIQLVTQKAIIDQIDFVQHATGKQYENTAPTTGYAVAMEVETGKVVAMASMPDYDPAIWQGGISKKDYDAIQFFQNNGTIREAQAPYANDSERNNHPSSLVYLGSTQKPLSILVGLNEKLFTTSTTYNDIGYFEFGRKGHEVKIRNANGKANGRINATEAIAKSSNAFMSAMVGNQLKSKGQEGIEIWDNYMKMFGLGVTTGSGLPGESAGVIDYTKSAKTESIQSALIRASWGQQAKYTTLQLAQYAATLASHGKRMKPQFVGEIRDVDGNVTQPFQPEVLNTVDFPESYWKAVEAGMAQVKVSGFEGVNYTFLRKTGTSQQDVGKRPRVENAVFIAYAPAENPKLAIAVVVPDGGYGGWGAAPIARKIFDAYDAEVGLYGTPRKPVQAPADTGSNVPAQGNAAEGANGNEGNQAQ